MPFWSESFQDPALKDPKRKFRFTVEFQGVSAAIGGAVLWYAKTVSKPSFPGSVTWQDVSVTLVDPVDPDMAATFSDIIVQGGYTPPSDATSLGTMSKGKASSALGSVIITQIDSDGNPLETWTLWNAFITEVKYGDLEYGGDDLTEMSLTLKYDWARVKTAGASVATAGSGQQEFFKV